MDWLESGVFCEIRANGGASNNGNRVFCVVRVITRAVSNFDFEKYKRLKLGGGQAYDRSSD
jgi:hypothetical protein